MTTSLQPLQADPNPPIPVAGLKGPLTARQRSTILSYIQTRLGSAGVQAWDTQAADAALQGITSGELDNILIADYQSAVSGGGFGGGSSQTSQQLSPPGLPSIESFLGNLVNPNTWVRVGEFAVGILIIGIAANAFLKNQTGTSPASKTGARLKTASKTAIASKAAPVL